MAEKDHITEKNILNAARDVFQRKGYAGARMQEIADEAGINKAMLHYYFRSKDKLFQAIFMEAANDLFGKILELLSEETGFEEKIRKFIGMYIDEIEKKPYLPSFVIHELNHNPDSIKFILDSISIKAENFFHQINEEMNKGNIIRIDPRHILMNLLSLVIFPFIAKPIFSHKMNIEDSEYKLLMEERKKILPDMFLNSIRIK